MRSPLRSIALVAASACLAATEWTGVVDGFEWYIPDPSQPVHGVLMPGWTDSIALYNTLKADPEWRATAKRLNFAITWSGIGYSLDGSVGRAPLITARLAAAAISLGHPELAHARVVLAGLSGGSTAAAVGSTELGDRALAHVEFHQAHLGYSIAYSAFMFPVLRLAGNTDQFDGQVTNPGPDLESEWVQAKLGFANGRPESASMDKVGHASAGPQRFDALWLDTVCRLRLPASITPGQAWSAVSLTKTAYPSHWVATCDSITAKNGSTADVMVNPRIYAAGSGSPGAGGETWLPSQRIASYWLTWITGTHSNADIPNDASAPTGLVTGLAATPGPGWVDLVWNRADDTVDPESGLGWYQVTRRLAGVALSEVAIPVYGHRAQARRLDDLIPGTAYEFAIAAVNRDGVVGTRSPWVAASTSADGTAATLVALSAPGSSGTTLIATFSEAVEALTAQNVANYAAAGLSLSTAVLGADQRSVTLTTSQQSDGTTINLTANGVKDLAGNLSSTTFATIWRQGLECWLRCDEGSGNRLTDASGTGTSAVFQGATWTTGQSGSGLLFDSSNDACWLADQSSLGLFHQAFSTRTFAVWFRSAGTAADQVIFKQGSSARGWGLRLNAGTLEGRVGSTSANLTCSTPFTDTTAWHHAALVFNAGTLTLYLDGVAKATQSGTPTTIAAQSDTTTLGCANQTDVWGHCLTSGYARAKYDAQFLGRLDEIRFYSRALSATEVAALVSPGGDTTPPVTPSAPTASSLTALRPTLSGTTEANASLRIYDNGTLVATVTANGSGAWTWTPGSDLTVGIHPFTLVAVDGAGNASGTSPATTVTVSDVTPPATPAAPSASSATAARPTLSGSTEAGASVRIYDNSTLVATVTANGSGAWTWTPGSDLTVGHHPFTVVAVDGAGNASGTSPAATVTVSDVTPPATPAAPSASSATATRPTLSGTTEANASVRIYDNGALVATVTANGSGAWTWTPGSDLTVGSHPFTVVAVDGAGNASATSPATTVTVTASDVTPPTTPAAPSASSATAARPTLSGSTEAGASVRIYDNGTLVATVTANGSGAWTWTATADLAAGTHPFTVIAVDAAGNASPVSAATVVTVAAAPLPAPAPAATSSQGGKCGPGGSAVVAVLLTLWLLRRRRG